MLKIICFIQTSIATLKLVQLEIPPQNKEINIENEVNYDGDR